MYKIFNLTQDYAFLEDLQAGGVVNSTLIIRESQSKHFGVYKCNVSNEYGSDTIEIVLKPNSKYRIYTFKDFTRILLGASPA